MFTSPCRPDAGAHTAPYPVGTRDSFPGVKDAVDLYIDSCIRLLGVVLN
jgi:hypothetical protein